MLSGVQSTSSACYSSSMEESEKTQSVVFLSDTGLDKNRLTLEQEKRLEDIKSHIDNCYNKDISTSTGRKKIKELRNEITQYITYVESYRGKIYDVIIDKRTGRGEMIILKPGCDETHRDSYLQGLIYLSKLRDLIRNEIDNSPIKYKKSLSKIFDVMGKSAVYGDIKALNEDRELPDFKYSDSECSAYDYSYGDHALECGVRSLECVGYTGLLICMCLMGGK
ncbi:NleF caspase inhibitor [Yersinia pseudotuberculosis]|uniref:NleF caspase inhibitor n=1 Tax=Yersinia pseudotuberculosis TaxID=633 RepID=UPI0005DBA5E2|nr:NleF caspase inhibitor [Yersinia pseudotuberculosis]CNC62703.1 Uncharacterised protein [Yersinia pseudotuberculosis]